MVVTLAWSPDKKSTSLVLEMGLRYAPKSSDHACLARIRLHIATSLQTPFQTIHRQSADHQVCCLPFAARNGATDARFDIFTTVLRRSCARDSSGYAVLDVSIFVS